MGSGAKNRSILLVDDIELFLELEQTFFHRDNFDLLMAVNSQEVMQLVLERRPDLIFLDMHIADARGDDICRWIRQDSDLQAIPIVMVVDAGDSEAEALCRQAGCDAIIQRPVSRRQLLSLARSYLDLAARQAARTFTCLQVDFGPDRDSMTSNHSVNLSDGGVFIATDFLMPVGTSLAIRLQFPGRQQQLACRGRVAWLNPPQKRKKPYLPVGIGVQFNPLAIEEKALVQNYLTSQ